MPGTLEQLHPMIPSKEARLLKGCVVAEATGGLRDKIMVVPQQNKKF